MNSRQTKPHILFLFSDTGGGHRSAAEAISEAITLEFGNQFSTEMVDIFKDYAPPPLQKMPDLYPKMVKVPRAWGLGYRLSNGQSAIRLLSAGVWPYVRSSLRQLIRNHPSDLIVSVHPLANAPMLQALGNQHPPFITVVTDLVSTHVAWYDPRADLCLVPTNAAREHALDCGLKPEQVQVVGLPVADKFCQPRQDYISIRQTLGWPKDLFTVLVVGGGEGMGPIKKNARAIAQAGLPISLVIVTGRNEKLKKHLEKVNWEVPTRIYGFVREMPDFMQAADVLVTKAGPGTITEAMNAGLPMILYSYLPGQESGNLDYVESKGAGVWAPTPEKVISALQKWIYNPVEHERAVDACLKAARPGAAREIAHILARFIQ